MVVEGGRLHDPATTIDARNSGTTARLLLGLCAGHGISARFDGDESLRRRPMERVARPLRAIRAHVETTDGRLPAMVRGVMNPPGGEFALEIPSAQVKSAILLANLDATGPVQISGDRHSRDHTERMLRHLGRDIAFDGRTIDLRPGKLKAGRIRVPADLSGAAFFIVAAAITPGSDLLLQEVGVNPTRTGFLDVLRAMGADIVLGNDHGSGRLGAAREGIRPRRRHRHDATHVRRRGAGAPRRIRRDRRGRAASDSAARDTWRSSHRDGDRSARSADRATHHRRWPLHRRQLSGILRALESRAELRLVPLFPSQEHRASQLRREA